MKKFFLVLILACIFLPTFASAKVDLYSQIDKQIVAGATKAELGTPVEPQAYIASIIQIALSTVAIVFIFLLVYGGYILILARGEEEQVKKATTIIRTAIIGLIIILASWSITYFITKEYKDVVSNTINSDFNTVYPE